MQATVPVDLITAWVAWEIAVPEWGRGYAVEAAAAMVAWLRDLGVATIAASIHPMHAASTGVARRLGLAATNSVDDDGEVRWELRLG
jgi:RimJ/RimL family protein N-acetyltransferase